MQKSTGKYVAAGLWLEAVGYAHGELMAGLQVNAGRDFSRHLGDIEIDRRGLGLIKPSISTAARARDEGMSKLFDDGAYAHQRLNLGTKGKAHGRNTKASNRT